MARLVSAAACGLTIIFLSAALIAVGARWTNTTISFMSDRDRYRHVFLYDARTQTIWRLQPISISSGSYNWLTDGDHLIVQTCRTTLCTFRSLDIFSGAFKVLDQDVGILANRRRLISPDGTRLVIANQQGESRGIVVLNRSTRAPTQLTESVAADKSPVWSPDGERIAFVSNRDGNNEIYVMDSDGTQQRRLTANSCDDSEPDWSPDSQSILFTADCDGHHQIYIVQANGSDLKRLIVSESNDSLALWRPVRRE